MPKKKTKKINDIKANPKKIISQKWYNLTLNDIAKKLSVRKGGLTQNQVAEREKKYGANTLPTKIQAGILFLLLNQFKSSLTYILLVAAFISFVIGEHIDAYVILVAVGINVLVGFIQEYKAQNALESLRRVITRYVWVVRDNMERRIKSSELVPGDIVILSAGNRVPADGRLFEASHLKINEATLTGESLPCEKINHSLEGNLVIGDRHNMVFSGTVVTEGHGKFFVTHIGEETELGKIAKLVKDTKEVRTPLQNNLDSFSKKLGLLVLAMSFILMVMGVIYGYDYAEMFIISVAIAVAAIPEGLVIGVTVILAIGMQRILKKGSLVRKLVAAETLGSTNVICADKTGTVTVGQMRVAHIVTENHVFEIGSKKKKKQNEEDEEKGVWELKRLNQIAVYCSDAVIASSEHKKSTEKEGLREQTVAGTATEGAILLSAVDGDFTETDLHEARPRLDEVPFDSKHKFMATLNSWTKKQNIIYIKGAPEKILNMAQHYQAGKTSRKLTTKKRNELIKLYEKLSRQGLRVLAGAYKSSDLEHNSFDELPEYNEDLVFVGFWGIKDPLRPTAAETIKNIKKAGVRTIIITGDNRHTALAVAKELGLTPNKDEVIDGEDLASIPDSRLPEIVKKVKIFSRATPEDKLRIVSALQKNGDVVAMTGDGVNDAPALQKADIGVALGSGTDVAKETADIVLLNNNFSTIVSAVRQGRVIFDNIRKVILYLLANSFTEMAVIIVGLLLGWPLPLLATQILWINLVTDGLPDLALTQEPEEPEIMTEKPQKRNAPILDFERKFLILFISTVTTVFTLGLFYLIWKTTGDIHKARTVAFTAVGVESLLYVFSVRSVRHSIFETNIFRNKWLIAAVVGGFIIQVLGVYLPFLQKVLHTVPLSFTEWLLILLVCFWIIGIIELVKHFFIAQRRVLDKA
jgi:P-type Ca2+ transporter type 2C